MVIISGCFVTIFAGWQKCRQNRSFSSFLPRVSPGAIDIGPRWGPALLTSINLRIWIFEFGAWALFVFWDLRFGISPRDSGKLVAKTDLAHLSYPGFHPGLLILDPAGVLSLLTSIILRIWTFEFGAWTLFVFLGFEIWNFTPQFRQTGRQNRSCSSFLPRVSPGAIDIGPRWGPPYFGEGGANTCAH